MIGTPDIGLARPDDAEAIALLSRDEIEYGLRWSWTPARVRRAILDRRTNAIVARNGERVVGFALMQYDDDSAHLLLLGVARAFRRRGIATAILHWLEHTLAVAGIPAVQVELRERNAIALAFYETLGFERVNATHRYYQGRETALHLVKELGEVPPAHDFRDRDG